MSVPQVVVVVMRISASSGRQPVIVAQVERGLRRLARRGRGRERAVGDHRRGPVGGHGLFALGGLWPFERRLEIRAMGSHRRTRRPTLEPRQAQAAIGHLELQAADPQEHAERPRQQRQRTSRP